ncbi:MAG: FAD-dependent thymidylate synthase [Fibrobacterota bacterium]
MKIQAITLTPPETAADTLKATPEILASSLARYSRSNKGIDHILSTVDWDNPDASVDRIFKFIDYGHASIGGLTGGIAICIDHCSMYLAYKIFELAQLVDGQESSTRYIEMDPSSLVSPEELGIDPTHIQEWKAVMSRAFDLYTRTYEELDHYARTHPESLSIPADVPEKVRKRMLKNYALDRCRYFIPLATKTSAAYIMTARVWADTLKLLDALPLREAHTAAEKIRCELEKIAPRLIKHSYADDASRAQAQQEWDAASRAIATNGVGTTSVPDRVFCSLDDRFPDFLPASQTPEDAFAHKKNRYSRVGPDIRRTSVRFAWNNIAVAELRDLNRHRSGNRHTPFIPVGFYLPAAMKQTEVTKQFLADYARLVQKLAQNNTHCYGYLLGTQVAFEHTTQLDKLIYEIELRTGLGAHFRYAEHLEAVYHELIRIRPGLRPFITLGTAEPE